MDDKTGAGMIYDKTPWGRFGEGLRKYEESKDESIHGVGMESKSSEDISKDDSKIGMVYDNSIELDRYATGDISTFFPKEDQIYSSSPDYQEVPFKGLPRFLLAQFEISMDKGPKEFSKTVDHFEKVLLGAASPAGEFYGDLKNLFAEVRRVKSKDELKQFWKKVEQYHADIELVKPTQG